MQATGICKGQLGLAMTRFSYLHVYSTEPRSSMLYRTTNSGLRWDKPKPQPPHRLLHVSSSMKEDTQQNDSGTKVVKVKFVLQRRCEFGQQFRVTGDDKLLGEWAPEAAIPMQWSEGHIWTVELDLSVGTCAQFKIILMAEQKVVEWQPGLNHKLELTGSSSSLVVFVPWSGEEDNSKQDPKVDAVINEFLKPQDGDKAAVSVESPPDLVEDMESETHSSNSVDDIKDQVFEERNTNSGIPKVNDKDVLGEWQAEGKQVVTGDQEVVDARTSLNSELKSSNFRLQFAIPESWYGEEPEQASEVSNSQDSTELSPASLEDIAKGETTSSEFKFASNNKFENEEKPNSLQEPDEAISEGSSNFIILTKKVEPITEDENDEELKVHDFPVEVSAQRNAGTLLSDTKLKDANEESSEKHIVQNDPIKVTPETRSETMIFSTVSNNQDQSDKEVLIDNDLPDLSTEVPEMEDPKVDADSLESVETKPVMTVKEQKWGHKGWSKLWGAFVHGRLD